MNKKIFLIILIGLTQIGNIFGAVKSESLSSSSSSSLSSSSLKSTSSPTCSSSLSTSSTNSDGIGIGKKIELTPFQQKTLEQLKKDLREINNFPSEIAELISLYSEPFNEEATKDLWMAVDYNKRVEIPEAIKKIEEALNNNANINSIKNSFSPLLTLTSEMQSVYPILVDRAFCLTKKLLEYPNLDVNVQCKNRIYTNTPLTNVINAIISDLSGYLSFSRRNELIEILELLLKKGANPNMIYENDGRQLTPLMRLALSANLNMIHNEENHQLLAKVFNLLLEHKADPTIGYDSEGNKFLDIFGNFLQYLQEMRGVREKVIKIIDAKSASSSSSSSSSSS